MAKGSRPVYIARARQGEDNEYMTTIGAAFAFKEGEGLVVNLHFMPLDGKFILVKPKDDRAHRAVKNHISRGRPSL